MGIVTIQIRIAPQFGANYQAIQKSIAKLELDKLILAEANKGNF